MAKETAGPGTRQSSDATERTCNLCSGHADLILPGTHGIVRCRDCGLLSLENFPGARERESCYQESYYSAGKGERFLPPFEWALGLLKRLRAQAILRRAKRTGTILDVGCGRGDLLEIFRDLGWRAVGTQISRTAAEAAWKRRGVDVRVGELPELDLSGPPFDAIAFFHVLEHLERPAEYLLRARDLLADDGLLVVEVPNCGSLGFRILGLRHFCIDYPHHLIFFTPPSLRALLGRCGFQVEKESHYSLEYSPFTALQNLLNLIPGRPDRLYRSFQANDEGRRLKRSPWTWIHALLGGFLALPALLISLGGLLGPVGNTMRFYCRKAKVAVEASAIH